MKNGKQYVAIGLQLRGYSPEEYAASQLLGGAGGFVVRLDEDQQALLDEADAGPRLSEVEVKPVGAARGVFAFNSPAGAGEIRVSLSETQLKRLCSTPMVEPLQSGRHAWCDELLRHIRCDEVSSLGEALRLTKTYDGDYSTLKRYCETHPDFGQEVDELRDLRRWKRWRSLGEKRRTA